MHRILITGGAGFVGSALAVRLKAQYPRSHVVCLDNLYRRGSEINRDRACGAGCEFVLADVRNRAAFDMPACDAVIDAAAEPSVLAGSGADVQYVVDTNLGGTLNVLEAARKWGAKVLFISTSRVYPVAALRQVPVVEEETRFEIGACAGLAGLTERGISEAFSQDGARTLYGATKFASEIMAREYATQFGLDVVIDRCGLIAGPWQMGRIDQGVVALWVAAHHYGLPLSYIGYGGRQVRDAVHVEDFADLACRQLERRRNPPGEVFNVGGGRAVSFSLRELTGLCAAATGRRVEVRSVPTVRPGDVPLYLTDAGRVGKEYDWRPTRDMAGIVEDTARWLHDHSATLRAVFGA